MFCKLQNKNTTDAFLPHLALRLCKWYDNKVLNCNTDEKNAFYGEHCSAKT